MSVTHQMTNYHELIRCNSESTNRGVGMERDLSIRTDGGKGANLRVGPMF